MEKFNPVIFLDLQNGREDNFRVKRGQVTLNFEWSDRQIVVLHTMSLSRSAVLFYAVIHVYDAVVQNHAVLSLLGECWKGNQTRTKCVGRAEREEISSLRARARFLSSLLPSKVCHVG